MNKYLLFLLFCLTSVNAHSVQCPPANPNKIYSQSELSALDDLTKIGKISLSKSIPDTESWDWDYNTLNKSQRKLVDSYN